MTSVVGIDIGATTTKSIVAAEPGTFSGQRVVPTTADDGPALVGSLVDLIAETGVSPAVVGIGIPGIVNQADESVQYGLNINIGSEPVPIGEMVGRRLGVPVVVENDTRVAALGAYHSLKSLGIDVSSLAYLNVGTGLSAGLILDGEIYRGATGLAGEIGHVGRSEGYVRCVCGQADCLESLTSGRAAGLNGAQVDHGADFSMITDLSEEIARAIHWVAAAYDAEKIVLGGGVVSRPDVRRAVRSGLASIMHTSGLARFMFEDRLVEIEDARFLGATGAAVLAWRRLGCWPAPQTAQGAHREGDPR